MRQMQWSRLKAAVEARFAPSLRNRVELRATRYRHAHDGEGRGWITLDGVEIFEASTLKHFAVISALDSALQQRGMSWAKAHATARARLEAEGIFTQWTFYDALQEYLSLSFSKVLGSTSVVHRALAMIDR